MSILEIITLLLGITALSGYLNHKVFHLPVAVGFLFCSVCVSILVILIKFFFDISFAENNLVILMQKMKFEELFLEGMLALMLFSASMKVKAVELKNYKYPIFLFSTVGVLISFFLIGYLTYFVLLLLDVNLPLIYCLLFGALISPTDPIAIMSFLKSSKNPSLKAKMTGESLFNDGMGIVLFLTVLSIIKFEEVNYFLTSVLLVKKIFGGVVVGILTASSIFWMMRTVKLPEIEILLTLFLAVFSYSVAEHVNVSAPISTVVAAIFTSYFGRETLFVGKMHEHTVVFWNIVDEILNSLLFVLMGLTVLLLDFKIQTLLLGVLIILIVLFSRYISVLLPGLTMQKYHFNVKTTPILMTWGGLRGGISIALALSLPKSSYRDLIITLTYCVVVFSILFQGLTFKQLLKILKSKKNLIS